MLFVHKKKIAIFITALLLCTALSGCSVWGGIFDSLTSPQGTPQESLPETVTEPLPSAPSPSVQSANETEESERRTVPFGQMEYARPDADAIIEQIESINAEVGKSTDFAALEDALEQAVDLYYEFSSMGSLASIHSSLDKSDAYWVEEEKYIMENYAGVELAYRKLYHSLYESPHKEEAEENWGEDYFDRIDDVEYVTEGTKPLYEREASLVSEYSEKLATATIPYDGEDLSYSDITQLSTYDDFRAAILLWYEAYNPELGELYIDLVKTRQQIAKELGFDNYTQLVFDSDDSEYSSAMVQSLLYDIVEYAVPVFQQQLEKGLSYNPSVTIDYKEFTSFARDVLNRLSPELLDSFDAMLFYGLIDPEIRPHKEQGAFTTFIYDYDAPFIVLSYQDDASSMRTLVHEFGHFNEYYVTKNEFLSSTDTAEVFSQALELLFANHYGSRLGQDSGYKMLYDTLSSAFDGIVEQSYYTALEMRVYEMDPDTLTVDAINQAANEEMARFGLDGLVFEEYGLYDWVSVPHLFELPYYTFSYATSADVALQLWELSLTDEQAAINAYEKLLHREQATDFLGNIEAAGLENPFSIGRMRDLSALAEKYLIREDWSSGSAEAA